MSTGGIYEEVEIEDMTYDSESQAYTYPCPCGDKFAITLEELHDGEDIGLCPSCTLRIRVIFDPDKLPELMTEADEEPETNKVINNATPAMAGVALVKDVSVFEDGDGDVAAAVAAGKNDADSA